jgi:hypothetical protein
VRGGQEVVHARAHALTITHREHRYRHHWEGAARRLVEELASIIAAGPNRDTTGESTSGAAS